MAAAETKPERKLAIAYVNEYLRVISGQDFTAKDFRTWAGSVLACELLHEFEGFDETQAKRNIVQAIKSVAARLRNTPSVCRKCYVHPAVLGSYMSGAMLEIVKRRMQDTRRCGPSQQPLIENIQQT